MGNTAAKEGAPRTLEVHLSPPRLELPPGRNGQPYRLLASVGVLEDTATAREAAWDKALLVPLPRGESGLLVSVYAAEPGQRGLGEAHALGEARLFAEVCLPLAGPGGLAELGLRPGGPPLTMQLALSPGSRCGGGTPEELAVAFQRAREAAARDRPCLGVSLRELSREPAARPGVEEQDWTLPPARRQVIALEL